MAQQL